MANPTDYNYGGIENPYDAQLERGEASIPDENLVNLGISSPYNIGESAIDGKNLDNITISSYIKSRSYKPKVAGFFIDGKRGYIECMQLYVGSGGIIGGSLDIPDTVTPNSFHVASDGTTWWGANNAAGYTLAPAYVLPTGQARFADVTITGTSSVETGTLDGLVEQDNLSIAQRGWSMTMIFSPLDFDTVQWTSGTFTTSSGVNYSIVAGNTGNMSALTYIYIDISVSITVLQVTTNSANAVGANKVLLAVAEANADITSDASLQVFGGSGGQTIFVDNIAANSLSTNEFVSNSAQIADLIVTSAKINSLVADKITAGLGIIANLIVKSTLTMGDVSNTGYIQSYGWSGVSLPSAVDGYQLVGGTSPEINIIGGNIRTGPIGGIHMVLNNSNLTGYSDQEIVGDKRMQLDYDSFELYNASGQRTFTMNDVGFQFWNPVTNILWADINLALGWLQIATYRKHLYLSTSHNEAASTENYIAFDSKDPDTSINILLARAYRDTSHDVSIFGMGPGSTRIESNYYKVGIFSQGYINFANQTILTGSSGYGLREDVSGRIQFKHYLGGWVDIPISGGTGTVTSVSAGTGMSFTTITTTGSVDHSTADGWKHIPSGGSNYEMLYRTAAGTASWTSAVFVGASSSSYFNIISGRINCSVDLRVAGSSHMTGNVYTGGVLGSSGGVYAAQYNIGTSSYINWNSGSVNVYIDDSLYVNGQLRAATASVLLNNKTYTRTLMSTVVPGGTGYILHSTT